MNRRPPHAAYTWAAAALALIGCSEPFTGAGDDGDADRPDGATRARPDAGRNPRADAGAAGAADAAPTCGDFDPGPAPVGPLQPTPGEVSVIQLDLPPGITVRLAESAIIVGPDGQLVLLDLGNSPHDDDVREAVRALNTQVLTPARGYPARRPLQVEWVLLTHLHGDHVGAFRDLFVEAAEPLELVHGVVHRGFVDLGAGMNEADYGEVCTGLRGRWASADLALCHSSDEPPCAAAQLVGAYPATDCAGLFWGNLANPSDDGDGTPSFIDLGGGARITFYVVNGYASDGTRAIAAPTFGHESGDDENARSLGGILSFGDFRYHFAGDLHGRPSDGPDIESHLVDVVGERFIGPLGVDVVHAHHHARRTSSNSTFAAAMAPADGRSRNVVAGINGAYLGSPYAEVLDSWGAANRLGDGHIWVTAVTVGGATSADLIDAKGALVLQTIDGGVGYRLQAPGANMVSQAYESVRHRACAEGQR